MKKILLTKEEILSLLYHANFSYPMKKKELEGWLFLDSTKDLKNVPSYSKNKDYFFIKGRGKDIETREKRYKHSLKKIKKANKYLKYFKYFPSILFVGITGSLAMMNADEKSDIDLMIITKENTLWVTRGLVLVLFLLLGIPVRRSKEKDEKDKLCLNLWLDEGSLAWDKKERNVFTAHEMLQIMPLINKNNIYKKLIDKNKWVYKFWRKEIVDVESVLNKGDYILPFFKPFNYPAYLMQYLFMKRKITNETVELHKALYHPNKMDSILKQKT